ncbi:MAG TPA: tetratricopeptide repeat protein [Mucilaginibacter sp.]
MKYLLTALLIIASIVKIFAQNADEARTLVKEGTELIDREKYVEAIGKLQQALKLDTGSLYADYQLSRALFMTDKGKDGIPLLEKILKTDSKLKGPAYELLGLIYFKNHQYAEAEINAVEAIKLDPTVPSRQRMYALVSFHQDKRAQALLGFCSYILLKPVAVRSGETFGNIQHILQGGTLKPEPGETAPHAIDASTNALNQAITQAVADFGKRRYASAGDLLTAELKAIFINIGQLAEKQTGNDFFRKYLAAYFYQLAQSPNMPALARLISQSTPESAKWIKDNPTQMSELENWVKVTARAFE